MAMYCNFSKRSYLLLTKTCDEMINANRKEEVVDYRVFIFCSAIKVVVEVMLLEIL